MPENINIWDKFNEPDLEGEDWLEPNDSVFESIEKEIFPQKKKKRKFGFLWLFPTILILSSLGFFLQSEDKSLNETNATTAIEVMPDRKKDLPASDQIETLASTDRELYRATGAEKQLSASTADVTSDVTTSAATNVAANVAANKVSTEKSKSDSRENSVSLQTKKVVDKIETENTPPTIITESSKSEVISSAIELNNAGPPSQKFIENTEVVSENIGTIVASILNPILSIDKIQTPLEFEKKKVQMATIPHASAYGENHVSVQSKKSWLKLEFGLTDWDFNLNNNYSSALNSADFYSSMARGYNVSLGYGQTLNKIIDFNIDLTYNRINMKSGHNSEEIYRLDLENNLSNTLSVLMATPIGFINSEVEINRVDPSITDQETEFGIGIVNEHQITSIGVEPSLNFNLLKSNGFVVGPSVGIGFYYLTSITNKIAEVNSQHAAFQSSVFEITNDQQNINRFLTTINLGAQVERTIYSNLKVGINLNYKIPFQSSFNDQMDFSSSITQSDIGLYFKWNLE